MSLDLYLMDGGREVFERNLTYNYSRMWALATGSPGEGYDPPRSFFEAAPENPVRLVEIEGMTGASSIEILATAISAIQADPGAYADLNPSNGWGSSELLLGHLQACLAAATEHPDAVWGAWR